MKYSHTQKAPLGLILYSAGIAILVLAWFTKDAPEVPFILMAAGMLTLVAGLMFGHLTVCDEGQYLAMRYGPLPVFQGKIPYDQMTSVEPDCTNLLDGWGIHYVPWRGWTYNLWGFGCVKIKLGKRVIRVGTDEPEQLNAFLRSQIEAARPAA
jgi:hypothetical protein